MEQEQLRRFEKDKTFFSSLTFFVWGRKIVNVKKNRAEKFGKIRNLFYQSCLPNEVRKYLRQAQKRKLLACKKRLLRVRLDTFWDSLFQRLDLNLRDRKWNLERNFTLTIMLFTQSRKWLEILNVQPLMHLEQQLVDLILQGCQKFFNRKAFTFQMKNE